MPFSLTCVFLENTYSTIRSRELIEHPRKLKLPTVFNYKENYFSQKLHCSQSVLASFADECGITEEQAIKLGSCFGTGMRKGEVCGAVTGALMVLGLLYGQNKAGDAEGRQRANKVDDLMMNRFKEKCGSYLCNDLLGCDVRTMEGVQYCLDNKLFTEFCPKMVAAAVEVVEGIIEEMK